MQISGMTKAIVLIIAVIIVGSSVAIVLYNNDNNEPKPDAVILHTNDTHGYYDENLGFTSVAALKQSYEAKGMTVFLLDAGDMFQGTSATMLTDGSSTIDIVNTVGYDLGIPGNHDFDYTFDKYQDYIGELNFDIVCSNIVYKDTGEAAFDEYTILEKDGITLGVFGLTTEETPSSTMTGNVDELEFTDPIAAAERMVTLLEGMNVDYIVALGHLGIESSTTTSDDVCAAVEGIDIFIDGHSHTEMSNGKVIDGSIELSPSDTMIASTGCYIEHIGVIELREDSIKATLSEFEGHNEETDIAVEKLRADEEELLNEVIGSTEVFLNGDKSEARYEEVTLGDFVADIILDVSGADIGFINGGSLKLSIEIGDVTIGDVMNAIPYSDDIVTKTLTGEQIIQMMEHSFSEYPEEFAGFLQISNSTKVVYDPDGASGSKIVSVSIDDKLIEMTKEYVIAGPLFTMTGGDDYTILEDIPIDNTYEDLIYAIIDFFREIGTVTDVETGRIVENSS